MTAWLFVLLVATLQSAPTSAELDPNLIRVYIRTDDGGHPDELAARRESVKHLVAEFSDKDRRKKLIVVNIEDKADVMVDVLDRGVTVPRVTLGVSAPPGGRPDPSAPPMRQVQLRVTLGISGAPDPIAIKNKNKPVESEAGWKSAADDIAKQADKWIADHRTKILEARRGG